MKRKGKNISIEEIRVVMMKKWKRSELKKRAKVVLKNSYWRALLVALIVVFAAGGGSSGSSLNVPITAFSSIISGIIDTGHTLYDQGTSTTYDETNSSTKNNDISTIDESEYENYNNAGLKDNQSLPIIIFVIIGIVVLLAIALSLAIVILICSPFYVNSMRYYISAASGEVNLSNIVYCFEKDKYKPVVKTMFFKGLYNFLWTLLFIIPGIVKSYSYRMVPYILADNPSLDTKRAITLSRNLMKGNKFKAFLLDLSFYGWYLLGFIALFIGVYFVYPYVFSVNAELYLFLRECGLQNNLCTYEELNLVKPEPPIK